MSVVTVIATLKVQEEKASWLFDNAFKTLVEKSKQEPGVISYSLFVDQKEPGTFLFHEQYKSLKDLSSHSKSAHFLESFGKIKEFLTEIPEIRVVKPLL